MEWREFIFWAKYWPPLPSTLLIKLPNKSAHCKVQVAKTHYQIIPNSTPQNMTVFVVNRPSSDSVLCCSTFGGNSRLGDFFNCLPTNKITFKRGVRTQGKCSLKVLECRRTRRKGSWGLPSFALFLILKEEKRTLCLKHVKPLQ